MVGVWDAHPWRFLRAVELVKVGVLCRFMRVSI